MADAPRLSKGASLSVPERILLFCLASGTDWQRARITQSTVARAIVHDFVQRDPLGRLSLTKEGRAAFEELIGPRT